MTSVLLMLVMLGVFIESSQAIECYHCNPCDESSPSTIDCGNVCATVSYRISGALQLIRPICLIAIAYSVGQIINSVVSVCACVCLFVRTLTVAFLDRFLPKMVQRQQPPTVGTSSLGVNIAPPIPLFCPENRKFGPKSPGKPCEHANICRKCSRIAEIPASHANGGSGTR